MHLGCLLQDDNYFIASLHSNACVRPLGGCVLDGVPIIIIITTTTTTITTIIIIIIIIVMGWSCGYIYGNVIPVFTYRSMVCLIGAARACACMRV